MERYLKLYTLFYVTLFIVDLTICLSVPMNAKGKNGVEDVVGNNLENIQKMEYVGTGKDCGNFLDPCGNKDDPPCCSPDFCLQGYCQNNTMFY